ncbi:MAG: PH domain-containing protein, partial [Gaiellaceae bacterium]
IWALAAAAVVVGLALPLALDRYRQLGHVFDGRRLVLREGSIRRRWSELDPDAVVSFELVSSPGQRRAGLATLAVHLGQGAGSRRALDLGEDQAAGLLERVRPQLFEPLLPPD